MAGKILISSAYLPPVEYFFHIGHADEVFIEREENYLKQTYRNRCYILSAHGPQILSIPVYLGSLHKTPVKDIRIDYSKRWQQVHLGAIEASYRSSPYFEFYFEELEKIILKNYEFLIDLNTCLTELLLAIVDLSRKVSYTAFFEPAEVADYDYRYKIAPKKESNYIGKKYNKVFDCGQNFIAGISIIDLVFNMGPDSANYL